MQTEQEIADRVSQFLAARGINIIATDQGLEFHALYYESEGRGQEFPCVFVIRPSVALVTLYVFAPEDFPESSRIAETLLLMRDGIPVGSLHTDPSGRQLCFRIDIIGTDFDSQILGEVFDLALEQMAVTDRELRAVSQGENDPQDAAIDIAMLYAGFIAPRRPSKPLPDVVDYATWGPRFRQGAEMAVRAIAKHGSASHALRHITQAKEAYKAEVGVMAFYMGGSIGAPVAEDEAMRLLRVAAGVESPQFAKDE